MAMNDPIGDMLTRIRNAQMRRMSKVLCPSSKLRQRVLDVLVEEGYLRGYTETEVRAGIKQLEIELKYSNGQPAIREIRRVSKPGRRVYAGLKELQPVKNGLGVSILTTPKGVMSDIKAREENVGGEVLCNVF
jgi:small subunit ribosomal protein S8